MMMMMIIMIIMMIMIRSQMLMIIKTQVPPGNNVDSEYKLRVEGAGISELFHDFCYEFYENYDDHYDFDNDDDDYHYPYSFQMPERLSLRTRRSLSFLDNFSPFPSLPTRLSMMADKTSGHYHQHH